MDTMAINNPNGTLSLDELMINIDDEIETTAQEYESKENEENQNSDTQTKDMKKKENEDDFFFPSLQQGNKENVNSIDGMPDDKFDFFNFDQSEDINVQTICNSEVYLFLTFVKLN